MTPEEARNILALLDDYTVIGQADAQWALETIANLDVDTPCTVHMGRIFIEDVDRTHLPENTKVTRLVGDWYPTQ